MTHGMSAFDPDDVALLLERYQTPDSDDEPRRPPWTWPALYRSERAALARMIDSWVTTYNQVHATSPSDLIPPCWRHHPGLATELAVQLWLWYQAHHDPRTTILIAGDYYVRYLPAFRRNLDRLLGASPGECRRGEHPDTWRHETDQHLAHDAHVPTNLDHNRDPIDLLGELDFGFPT